MAGEHAPEAQTEARTVDAPPAAKQMVQHNGQVFTTIKEGLAHILVPAQAMTQLDTKKVQNKEIDPASRQSVFYNPIQQFNRDISVLAIRAYGDDLAVSQELRQKSSRARKADKKRDKAAKAAVTQQKDHPNGLELPEPSKASHAGEQTHREANGTTKSTEANEREGAVSIKRKADDAFPEPSEDARSAKAQKPTDAGHGEAETTAKADQGPHQQAQGGNGEPSKPKTQFKILDALSATGLRALRYAAEIPSVTSVVGNDLSTSAVESMRVNVKHNRLEDKIKPNEANAMTHMYSFTGSKDAGKYDVIDLDPYGTAAPFVDAALQALKSGGLLCVTCTDAGVWASCGYPEKTYALYGGTPIRGYYSHEGGLRLILNLVATAAAKQELAIEPLLSLSIDFYARCFIRVRRAPIEVKHLAAKSMLAWVCDGGCLSWKTQPLGQFSSFETKKGDTALKYSLAQGPTGEPHCEHCGFKTHLAGPMWAGPLHNPHFAQKILDYLPGLDKETYGTTSRIEGMITTVLEETTLIPHLDDPRNQEDNAVRPVPPLNFMTVDPTPFFIIPTNLASVLHCQAPGEVPVKGALRHAGYKAVRSHTKPGSIKTDAPFSFIWRMMREWVRQRSPAKEGSIKPRSAGAGIMSRYKEESRASAAAEKQKTTTEQKTPEQATTENAPAGGTDGASGEQASEGNAAEGGADGASGEQALEKDAKALPEIVFNTQLGKEVKTRRYVRYQPPPPNWGPMMRAKRK